MWLLHTPQMPSKKSVGQALRLARQRAGMSQDDFTAVSSRTFVSSIERGLKSPTVEKLSELASAMRMDPATLVVVASMLERRNPKAALDQICSEALEVLSLR